MKFNTPIIRIFIILASLLTQHTAFGQNTLKIIPLPTAISGVNEEFSGMASWKNRIYLLPQYGDHKETGLNGDFNLYSIGKDSVGRVVDGIDTSVTKFRTIKVTGLDKLPDSVKRYYQGFEAITIINKTVFLSIETEDSYAYCFVLKGTLNDVTNQIVIDPFNFTSLARRPFISNAGFESLTYLPDENKLIACYEFNASANGGTGYLIDTALKAVPVPVQTPFLYFRLTDIVATGNNEIFGLNYHWNGDYNTYLNNNILSNQESNIQAAIPDLRDSIAQNKSYLQQRPFARIVKLKNYKDKQWTQVVSFDAFKNNWEGIALFRKGALVITDANRSGKQLTTFAYIEF
ncbi:MAG TPA: hypothetical protein VIM55_07950 [Mucilaginibacter sp.]